MKDRADFARKGIARGRSVVVISCRDGIALVAENPSPSLHKIGEIYDKIAFAAVGKYNESRASARPECATPTCAATRTTGKT